MAKDIVTPVLVLRGSFDTSLGQNSANNLKNLANSRVITVPDARHLCYLNNSKYFHTVSLNFLDIVLNHITKSPFVSDV
jgi:pimeloyl-ACP methyl ester carboxylesterase